MKTDIFLRAIKNRQNLKFIYDLQEMTIEPYYVSRNRNGKKVIYGRLKSINEIRKFDYDKIANIRVIEAYKFSPLIPINSFAV